MSYGVMRGDYGGGGYGAMTGDPGLFGFLGGIAKTVARTAGSFIPGPAGAVLRYAGQLGTRAPAKPPVRTFYGQRAIPRPPVGVMPGVGPTVTKRQTQVTQVGVSGMPMIGRPRRRRMNYGNVRALKRADRRMTGFVNVAKAALKHTNYKVVSKQTGTRGRTNAKGGCVVCGTGKCVC